MKGYRWNNMLINWEPFIAFICRFWAFPISKCTIIHSNSMLTIELIFKSMFITCHQNNFTTSGYSPWIIWMMMVIFASYTQMYRFPFREILLMIDGITVGHITWWIIDAEKSNHAKTVFVRFSCQLLASTYRQCDVLYTLASSCRSPYSESRRIRSVLHISTAKMCSKLLMHIVVHFPLYEK